MCVCVCVCVCVYVCACVCVCVCVCVCIGYICIRRGACIMKLGGHRQQHAVLLLY